MRKYSRLHQPQLIATIHHTSVEIDLTLVYTKVIQYKMLRLK